MATNRDYKKEWFDKSQLDYFSAFITLWLSCNSWYNFHYSYNKDRENIDEIKKDSGNKNKIFSEFKSLLSQDGTKEQSRFFSNLEQLYYALNGSRIQPDKFLFPLSFETALIDHSRKNDQNAYECILIKNAKTRTGRLKKTVMDCYVMGDIVLVNNPLKIFAGVFEIIYQVRCMLVHGNLSPTHENLEIVKYCYFILYDLLKPFCE